MAFNCRLSTCQPACLHLSKNVFSTCFPIILAQALTVLTMVTAANLHAHPLERVFLLLPFFLGSAEIASGISGL